MEHLLPDTRPPVTYEQSSAHSGENQSFGGMVMSSVSPSLPSDSQMVLVGVSLTGAGKRLRCFG